MPFPIMPTRATGFTLVELLVVIGIIAVLIAILMPVLSKARAQAQRTVCLSNIRQLGIGILMYCNDNEGWFPTCARADDTVAFEHYPDDWVHWQANRNLDDSAIAKYVGRGEALTALLRCPSDSFDARKARVGIAPGQGPYLYSYGMNEGLAINVRSGPLARTKITMWRAPSRKILLTEMLEKYVAEPIWSYAAPLAWRHGTGISRGNAFLQAGARMGTNVSAAFLDGHAESVNDDFACNIFQIQRQAR